MAFKIGFTADHEENKKDDKLETISYEYLNARKCVVKVHFPSSGRELYYYNDRFNPHIGDIAFVEGKLEGERGRVTEIINKFKIKLSDYKRVISLGDTRVRGKFVTLEGMVATFDRTALSKEKVRSWFFPQSVNDEEEYIVCGGDDSFSLQDLSEFDVSPQIFDRGREYYIKDKVEYLCLDEDKGYAIVSGTRPYEVEFEYSKGRVSNIYCTCPCAYNCKHEVAVIFQLHESLEKIESLYLNEYAKAYYFATMPSQKFFATCVGARDSTGFTL